MLDFYRQNIGELECVIGRSKTASENASGAVLLCHGFGAPSTDLVSCAFPFVQSGGELNDAVYVFPAAPIELDPNFDSRAWWELDIIRIQSISSEERLKELRRAKPDTLVSCRESINQVIAKLRDEFQLPSSKIVVGGFSQGSMLATDVALNYEETLGGLIVWSGTLLNEEEWSQLANSRDSLSIMQSHGTRDGILPFKGAELLRDVLTEAKHQVDFVSFAGEHAIPEEAIEAAVNLAKQACKQR